MTTEYTSIAWDDIDPTVIIDDDGQAYLFWGNTQCYYAKLKENMTDGYTNMATGTIYRSHRNFQRRFAMP